MSLGLLHPLWLAICFTLYGADAARFEGRGHSGAKQWDRPPMAWSEELPGGQGRMHIQEVSPPTVDTLEPEDWHSEFHSTPRWHQVEHHYLKPLHDAWLEEDYQKTRTSLLQENNTDLLHELVRGAAEAKLENARTVCIGLAVTIPIPAIFVPVKFGLHIQGKLAQDWGTGCYSWTLELHTEVCIGWAKIFRICVNLDISLETKENTVESIQDDLMCYANGIDLHKVGCNDNGNAPGTTQKANEEGDVPLCDNGCKSRKEHLTDRCYSRSPWTLVKEGIVLAAKKWYDEAWKGTQSKEIAWAKKARARAEAIDKEIETFYTTMRNMDHSDFKWKVVPRQYGLFKKAYDGFATNLPKYVAQATKPLTVSTAKIDKVRSFYTSGHGRFSHRAMRSWDEADVSGSLDGVLNFRQVQDNFIFFDYKLQQQKLPMWGFQYNSALSAANYFVRVVKDVQALFNLYFVSYPEWDGGCFTVPPTIGKEEDGKNRLDVAKAWHWAYLLEKGNSTTDTTETARTAFLKGSSNEELVGMDAFLGCALAEGYFQTYSPEEEPEVGSEGVRRHVRETMKTNANDLSKMGAMPKAKADKLEDCAERQRQETIDCLKNNCLPSSNSDACVNCKVPDESVRKFRKTACEAGSSGRYLGRLVAHEAIRRCDFAKCRTVDDQSDTKCELCPKDLGIDTFFYNLQDTDLPECKKSFEKTLTMSVTGSEKQATPFTHDTIASVKVIVGGIYWKYRVEVSVKVPCRLYIYREDGEVETLNMANAGTGNVDYNSDKPTIVKIKIERNDGLLTDARCYSEERMGQFAELLGYTQWVEGATEPLWPEIVLLAESVAKLANSDLCMVARDASQPLMKFRLKGINGNLVDLKKVMKKVERYAELRHKLFKYQKEQLFDMGALMVQTMKDCIVPRCAWMSRSDRISKMGSTCKTCMKACRTSIAVEQGCTGLEPALARFTPGCEMCAYAMDAGPVQLTAAFAMSAQGFRELVDKVSTVGLALRRMLPSHTDFPCVGSVLTQALEDDMRYAESSLDLLASIYTWMGQQFQVMTDYEPPEEASFFDEAAMFLKGLFLETNNTGANGGAQALPSEVDRNRLLEATVEHLYSGTAKKRKAAPVRIKFVEACQLAVDVNNWKNGRVEDRSECEEVVLSKAFVSLFPTFVKKVLDAQNEINKKLVAIETEDLTSATSRAKDCVVQPKSDWNCPVCKADASGKIADIPKCEAIQKCIADGCLLAKPPADATCTCDKVQAQPCTFVSAPVKHDCKEVSNEVVNEVSKFVNSLTTEMFKNDFDDAFGQSGLFWRKFKVARATILTKYDVYKTRFAAKFQDRTLAQRQERELKVLRLKPPQSPSKDANCACKAVWELEVPKATGQCDPAVCQADGVWCKNNLKTCGACSACKTSLAALRVNVAGAGCNKCKAPGFCSAKTTVDKCLGCDVCAGAVPKTKSLMQGCVRNDAGIRQVKVKGKANPGTEFVCIGEHWVGRKDKCQLKDHLIPCDPATQDKQLSLWIERPGGKMPVRLPLVTSTLTASGSLTVAKDTHGICGVANNFKFGAAFSMEMNSWNAWGVKDGVCINVDLEWLRPSVKSSFCLTEEYSTDEKGRDHLEAVFKAKISLSWSKVLGDLDLKPLIDKLKGAAGGCKVENAADCMKAKATGLSQEADGADGLWKQIENYRTQIEAVMNKNANPSDPTEGAKAKRFLARKLAKLFIALFLPKTPSPNQPKDFAATFGSSAGDPTTLVTEDADPTRSIAGKIDTLPGVGKLPYGGTIGASAAFDPSLSIDISLSRVLEGRTTNFDNKKTEIGIAAKLEMDGFASVNFTMEALGAEIAAKYSAAVSVELSKSSGVR